MSETDHQLTPMLTMDQVRQLIPLSPTTLYRMIKAGNFPPQIHLGPNRIAFDAGEIQQWIANRPQGSRPARR